MGGGSGVFEGGGGIKSKGGELGNGVGTGEGAGAGTVVVVVEMMIGGGVNAALARLSTRLRHNTVSTTRPPMTRTMGGTMAAVSTPPDVLWCGLSVRRGCVQGKCRR